MALEMSNTISRDDDEVGGYVNNEALCCRRLMHDDENG